MVILLSEKKKIEECSFEEVKGEIGYVTDMPTLRYVWSQQGQIDQLKI